MATNKNLSFEAIVKKYQRKIYYHVRRMVIDHDDADDLTQDTFLKVWEALDSFRGEAEIYTWIYRIATNECLSFLKKKNRMLSNPASEYADVLANKLEDEAPVDADEIQVQLQRAIMQLPDKQRLVFNMRYFEEMKYEDIARVTGTSVGALKATYSIAVHKIENFINALPITGYGELIAA
ncbi:RNA polymerase, sigma-24 subunit, RpoE [Pseudarcicella hirudinis]|uniref:RNA polymerase sigma factor n=1 Tax=Pseudarcicella hirudinis TaxID=1079859 RepID=A0A1I5UVH9_9BACT|nr:RNA polymerase sigma factor [Pseudarcicella hirudinis]SFP99210.1 RNA polymerase, sigma-24 subunit, RpoE [Pseudarcicella hirudinis]